MIRRVLWRAVTALIVLSIAVPLVQASPMPRLPEEGPPPPLPQTHEPEVTGPGGRGAQPDPLSKLDSELRELAEEGGEEAVTVYVRAKAGADLSGVANVTEMRPFVDDELVVAEVEPAMLAKLASHPDVLAAEKFQPVSPPKPISPRSEEVDREELRAKVEELRAEAAELKEAGGEGAPEIPEGVTAPDRPESPEDWNGSDLIGAPEAWAKGYTGEGVNIAILDSGVDFGHPDLEDNIAFYDGGAYDGWPIALDPRSMRQYYYNGRTGWDNYYYGGDYSWYADARDVLHCTDGMTTSFTFDGYTYSIAAEIAQMSQSGEIRWGAHPDVQLPWYVSGFGNWMPFILVDSTTAGVYDTVIADLNFDFWFDAIDDTAVLGTTDPVLNQDFGSYVYTDTVVMTGTQYIPDWWWWLAPTWYGGWETTVSTATLGAGTFILAENHYTAEGATTGEDGIADISGGMAYFIADGERPVPGMDYLYPGFGPAGMPPIPFNGQLVAFMLGSDYVAGYDHGTLCASAATASGNITGYFSAFGEKVQYDPEDWSSFFNADDVSEYLPWLKDADEGTVQGPAPGADIIALGPNYDVVNGMQGFYDSYTFLAYGVDGEPNSGDEFVDIASMSYGDGSVHNDGWDWESRLISYYNQTYLPNTTFLASSGNGGHGFGTINSPQGNTTVSVGASTQYGASDVFGSALAADQINDGEVQPFSGRGPDALGRPDPDVVATGAWGAGDTPLNMSAIYNYYVGGGWFPGDGNNAWYEWGGTSRSAPEAAGVTALIYQAYKDAMGSAPDFETARQILMSGADDLNHDVLMQGAGRVNADRATDVAGGLDGVYASPSLLAAGEYQGTHYESFGNVLFPGDTWDQTFTVHNPGAASASVTVGDEVLMEMDVMTYTQVVSPFLGTEGPYPATYYYHADYFVEADPAAAEPYAMVRAIHAAPLAGGPQVPVELCVDGNVVDPSLGYTENTGYVPLPEGTYLVEAYAVGSNCTGTPAISADVPLAAGTDYSIVATDYFTQVTPIALVDDNSEPAAGNAHVRFVHASPDAPAVDIAVAGGGPVLFSDVEFQEATDYLPVPAGTYDLEVLLAGTSTVVLTVPGVTVDDGEVYTAFAMGLAGGDPALEAVLFQDTPLPTRPVEQGESLAIDVPAGADLMQVQLVTPFELFDFNYNDPDPYSVSYSTSERWSLTVYDWQDRNGDGKLWTDTNVDGVVSASTGDLVDVSWTGAVTQTEINRFAYGYNVAAEQEVTVRLGDRADVDNVVLGIVHRNPNTVRPGWGPDEYQEHPLQIKVVFYEKTDWDLVTESPSSLTVPAGGEATFDATFTVPSDQAPGLYEGAITVDDGTHVSIIPTTVNVAVPGDELLFDLGGTEKAGTPYDNGRMFGGWTWSNPLEQGDWRFYYYDADAGFEQQYLYVRNQWGELCDNMPTANETLVWGPNPGDQFSMAEPEKFGPYGMQFAGGTWGAYGPQTGWYNPRRGDWWENADGTPQPETRVWATLWDGLNQVQFRNILNTGDIVCGEEFEATAGVFGVDAPMEGLQVDTDQLSGSFELDAVSPVDGLIAYAGGFGDKETFKNQDVPQGKHYERWPEDLMDGWVHTFEVTNSWGIEARTFGPWSSDIDLYLLYDANDDGVFNPYDNRETIDYGYSGGSHEYISYWGNYNNGYRVQDGTYAVVMYGYYVEPGDQFDLHLMLHGGDDLNIAGADAGNNYVLDVTPGAAETLTVNWEVPSSGVWHGMLWFGMPWEEGGQYYSMGPGFYVPVTVNAGGIDASVTKTVDREWVLMGREILTYTIEVMNDGNEDAYVEVVDLLPEGVDYHEQWIDDPDEPGDGEWYVAEWRFANGAHGYFWPDGDDYLRWDGDVGPGDSGKLTIQYQVKVKDGFVGEIVNKADVTFDHDTGYHSFLSSIATTEVLGPVIYVPIITRNW